MPRSRPTTIATNPLESKSQTTFTVTKSNLTVMSKKIGTIIRTHKNSKLLDGQLANKLNQILRRAEHLVNGGDSRKNFGRCQCTHPPSMGFCFEGICIMANWNFSSLSGSLTITINF